MFPPTMSSNDALSKAFVNDMQYNVEDESSECVFGLGAKVAVDRRQTKSIVSLLKSGAASPLKNAVCFVSPCRFLDNHAFRQFMHQLVSRKEVKHMVFFGETLTLEQIGILLECFCKRPLQTLEFRNQRFILGQIPKGSDRFFRLLPLAVSKTFSWYAYGTSHHLLESILRGIRIGLTRVPNSTLVVEVGLSGNAIAPLLDLLRETNVVNRAFFDDADYHLDASSPPRSPVCDVWPSKCIVPRLKDVEISLSSLIRKNNAEALSQEVVHSQLDSLSINCYDLDQEDKQVCQNTFDWFISQTLGHSKFLKHFTLAIDDDILDMRRLMGIIRRRTTIESISLCLVGLRYEVLAQMIHAIAKSSSIRNLSFAVYGMTRLETAEGDTSRARADDSEKNRATFVNALDNYLRAQTLPDHSPKLQSLTLDYDGDFADVNRVLAKYLKDFTALRRLQMSPTPEEPPVILEAIRRNKTLEKIELMDEQNAEASGRIGGRLRRSLFFADFRARIREHAAANRAARLISAPSSLYPLGLHALTSPSTPKGALFNCLRVLVGKGLVPGFERVRCTQSDTDGKTCRKRHHCRI